jgi:uncharacterized protein (TIRG00374 family)
VAAESETSSGPPGHAPRSSRARSLALSVVKVLVAAALITWLVRRGSLDLGTLAILVERPGIFALNLGLFLAGVVISTLRWRFLLELAGVRPPLRRLLQLQLTAIFFNVVIPGAIGGDVLKALYVARDAPPEKRTTILLIVPVERALGLGGLVTLASIVTLLRGPALFANPDLRPLASAVLALGAAALLGPIIVVVSMRRAGARVQAWTSGSTRIAKLLGRIVASVRLLSSGPKYLAFAFGLSMLAHACTIGYFTVLARTIASTSVSFSEIATVFPLGLLSMAIPIAPAGLGVGHVVFEKLLATIGVQGGATIFNVYLIGQMALCMLGAFPYVTLKRSGGMPSAEAVVDGDLPE